MKVVRWLALSVAGGFVAAVVFFILVGAGAVFVRSLLEFVVAALVFVGLLAFSAKVLEPAIQAHQSRTQSLTPAFIWFGGMLFAGVGLPILAAWAVVLIPLGGL